MTPWQRQLTAMITVLAGTMVATHGAAQEPAGKVLLPWQKPQPSMRPAPDMREILPWLMGEEDISKPSTNDAMTWAATVADPTAPVEPVVAEPVQAKARLETGTVVPSGLVLKKPMPVVHAAAAPAPASKERLQLAEGETAAAAPVTPSPEATPADPASESSTASPGENPQLRATTDWDDEVPAPKKPAQPPVTPEKVEAAPPPAQPVPAATAAQAAAPNVPTPPAAPSVEPAKAPASEKSTPVIEAAPAMPEAEEVPSIPEPLPEAVVTPVPAPANAEARKSESAKSEPATSPARAAAAASELVPATKPNPPRRLADGANVAQQYCFNIADAAKDARYAWQKKTLADVEIELKKRIALLDQRTAEYQKWLARRDEFIRTAEEGVVKIYSGMKPDTAATQLALMHEETAAAVLVKLNTRNASAILNEMESTKAARLTQIITGAAKLKRKKQREQEAAAAEAAVGDAAAPATDAAPATAADGGRS